LKGHCVARGNKGKERKGGEKERKKRAVGKHPLINFLAGFEGPLRSGGGNKGKERKGGEKKGRKER